MSAAEDEALFDLLPDGIASVDRDTGLLRPRNAAMRALLRTDAGMVALGRLLPEAAARDLLLGGDAVELQVGDAWWQLRLLPAPATRWLLARDVTEQHCLLAQAQAGARARLLGSVAHSIVHDLGNLLHTTIGMAEQLQPVASAVDRVFLGKVMQGTRQGAELLRTLARQLQVGARRVGRIDLDAMVSQVVALCAKSAAHRGCELRWQPGSGPCVRGVAEDLEFALLQGLLRALSCGEAGGGIAVVTAATVQPLAGGRERCHGEVRIGAPAGWVGDATALVSDRDGELLQSALLLRCSGGDLRVEREADRQWLVFELPREGT